MRLKPISLFRYAGSKAKVIKMILHLLPDHTRYVSLFGGSGADLIHKPRSRVEIYNDLSKDVVNVFRVLRSGAGRKRLRELLYLTPYSRLQFAECVALLHSDEQDPVMRAWAFLYCSLSNASGADPGIHGESSFGSVKTDGLRPNWNDLGRRIESVGRRFRQVIVENRPWQDIVVQYDSPETLFYADPPYVHSTRTSRYYLHEMTDEQHVELLESLRRVKGLVVISGYDSPLYQEHVAGWQRHQFNVKCSLSHATTKPFRDEVVWMNYDKNGKRLLESSF